MDFLDFLGNVFDFSWIFWRNFFGEFFLGGNFFGRIFLRGFFGRIFLGGFFERIFWEEFFGRIFLGGILWEIFFVYIGIDLFVKILVFVEILSQWRRRRRRARNLDP